MPCPDFQAFMLPMLQGLSDGQERTLAELRTLTADKLGLTSADREERDSGGRQLAYVGRAGWACVYMRQAGLLERVRRAVYRIAPRGLEVLATKPARVDLALLSTFAEFSDWMRRDKGTSEEEGSPPAPAAQSAVATPQEQIHAGYGALRRSVETELLDKILAAAPAFFENLVVELLVAMGYGGSRDDAGEALGRSGDGGVDGIIKEDRLGLDAIYIQAKRYAPGNKVSRPDVQAFAGSLEGHRARKGVFITTSAFSREAHDYVSRIEKKIILIDGPLLTRLLFEHGVGVRTTQTYEAKEIDEDYFLED